MAVPPGVLTTDAKQLLNDPAIDIVIELVGGYDFAKRAVFNKMLDGSIGDVCAVYGTYLTGPVKPMPKAESRPAGMSDLEWMVRNWYNFTWLSATGTGILCAAVVSGLAMGYRLGALVRVYADTLRLLRFSLATIASMLALGYTTRYSGLDSTLGLAFAHTGVLYPFFGTLLGWLGVALTGSDTSSNVLFGGLQVRIARAAPPDVAAWIGGLGLDLLEGGIAGGRETGLERRVGACEHGRERAAERPGHELGHLAGTGLLGTGDDPSAGGRV